MYHTVSLRTGNGAMASTRHSAKKRKPSTAGQIQRMVKRIVSRFAPDRIILFGSHARGCAGPDSDVDLLIIMPVQGSKQEQAIKIGVALHDIRIPKDLIVVTPEEFEWRKDVIGTIEWPAWREGKVLYARTG
jgi:predicted nucleotidyltransferase